MHKYYLIDTNIAAAYFAPVSSPSAKLSSRSKTLFEERPTGIDPVFLMPIFCIAETFAVFEKYRWGSTWNPKLKKNLTPVAFRNARATFRDAIHNGKKINQCQLERYHVLCVDLISPINAGYKIKRARKRKPNVVPASAADMLIVATGIWLKKEYGGDNFCIVTADRRLSDVANKATSTTLSRPMRSHLDDVAASLSLGKAINCYPQVVNLNSSTKSELRAALPEWSFKA